MRPDSAEPQIDSLVFSQMLVLNRLAGTVQPMRNGIAQQNKVNAARRDNRRLLLESGVMMSAYLRWNRRRVGWLGFRSVGVNVKRNNRILLYMVRLGNRE